MCACDSKKSSSDELFVRKFRILSLFSIFYLIRILIFGRRKLVQHLLGTALYAAELHDDHGDNTTRRNDDNTTPQHDDTNNKKMTTQGPRQEEKDHEHFGATTATRLEIPTVTQQHNAMSPWVRGQTLHDTTPNLTTTTTIHPPRDGQGFRC